MAGAMGGGVSAVGIRCQVGIDENGWYSWRLTANNGRVIALGAVAYPDDALCRAAFQDLCESSEGLVGGVQHAAESNGWIWRLRDADGRVQAESARAYERHSTCQAAYDRFRLLLQGLAVAEAIPWDDAN
ncbi:hypothetical protein [Actinacidiphila acididurans]|uniref:DUF1508 domain-containing protein n=1 Tax=Actinacidiphila acididurans TaxID=2784346 RepID=A0ABS2TMP4_9ACTN|nr:hypothetical protein [Actinacidiphila acididurans]MBM9504615.1 hypothetical protein [Actinacidiphila acididurans]